MTYDTDRGLRVRMAATLVALGVLYVAFVGVLSAAVGGLPLVVAGAVLALALQYYYADRIALRAVDAEPVTYRYPDLQARLGRLAQHAGVPTPDLAVVDTAEPNAFATGRNRSNATVCVTTGLLQRLDDRELDAVLAHELAHVKHRDAALLTTVSALSTVAYLVVRHCWWFGDGGGDGGGGGDSSTPWMLVAVAASLVVWVASYLLIRTLSRYREFAADRGSVAITGDPASLAGALRTIEGADPPETDLRSSVGTRAMCIVPGESDGLRSLLETHPPVEARIRRLEEIERSRTT